MNAKSKTRLRIRLFNEIAATILGKQPPEFLPHTLMETAARRNGSWDFGEDTFLEGLNQLCNSLNQDSKLHYYGYLMARATILNFLRNRLELEKRWKEHPEVLDEPVKQPVFILGPPRTGTTLLFNLLAINKRFRYIRAWEAFRPGISKEDQRLVRKAKKWSDSRIRRLNYLCPDLDKIHHLGTEDPEECIPLMANSFESGTFPFAFNTSSYHNWYIAQDHRNCYLYYRKQLQWMQSQKSGSQWLLKSPAHLSAITTLLETFPDALIIQTHRDPKKIIPSVSNLEYAFHSMVTYNANKSFIGEMALDYLAEIMETALQAREKANFNVVDVLYEDLVKEPFHVVERIYQALGESLTPEMRKQIGTYLAANPKNKYGKHKYSIWEIGLDAKIFYDRFDFYYDRFNFAAA